MSGGHRKEHAVTTLRLEELDDTALSAEAPPPSAAQARGAENPRAADGAARHDELVPVQHPFLLSPSSTPDRRERRPLTGRFRAEELSCFKRVPEPSPCFDQKMELLGQSKHGLRRICSDSGLYTLSSGSERRKREMLKLDSSLRLEPFEKTPFQSEEDKTAMVLEQIYPRDGLPSPSHAGEKSSFSKIQSRKTFTQKGLSSSGPLTPPDSFHDTGKPVERNHGKRRLMAFRQKILEKFSTIRSAFEQFAKEIPGDGSGVYYKELNRAEFSRFLTRHLSHEGLSRSDTYRIFDFLDTDKNGCISLQEFHTAIETVAPVRTMEDLRRKLIAFGYSSMRHVLGKLCAPGGDCGQRISLQELGVLLAEIGIHDEEEHRNIFLSVSNPHNPSGTISLDELSSGLAAVSPACLLEDIRFRLIQKYGSLTAAYDTIDTDGSRSLSVHEFVKFAVQQWRMTPYEARKAFRLIDIDNSELISRREFLSAMKLSEPALMLEEIRKKVRQRFQSIREIFGRCPESTNLHRHGYMAKGMQPELQGSRPPTSGRPQSTSSASTNRPLRKVVPVRDAVARKNSFSVAFTADAYFDAFQVGSNIESMHKCRTPAEFHTILNSLQLTDADINTLFELVDIDRDGKLSADEFVRGIRIFAPSCLLEDLRFHCLSKYNRVADAFAKIPPEKHDTIFDMDMLSQLLLDVGIAEDVHVRGVIDLVEPRGDNGVTIGELIAALQSSSSGAQVPLPLDQLDARSRQEIRWQMAPFHRTASELRADVRRKLFLSGVADIEPSASLTRCTGRWISQPGCRRNPKHGHNAAERGPGDPHHPGPGRKAASLEGRAPTADENPRSKGILANPLMKQSYTRVSSYVQMMPPAESTPILDRLEKYFSSAGSTLANDVQLLSRPQSDYSRYQLHYSTTGHWKKVDGLS